LAGCAFRQFAPFLVTLASRAAACSPFLLALEARVTQLDRRVSAQEDSAVTPVAQYLAALPNNYSEADVIDRVFQLQLRLFNIVVDGMRDAREIFTPEQINEFPPFLRASFDINRLLSAKPTKGFNPDR
jgi:hypothetical protein